MAIEIIPRSKTKKKDKVSSLDILYYCVVILLFVSPLIYFGLYLGKEKLNSRLEELEILIEEENEKIMPLEQKVLAYKYKIDLYANTLNSYRKASSLFGFLADVCHKKSFFSEINLNVKEARATLGSRTKDFKTLREQVLILRNEDLIRNIELSGIVINKKEGGINFVLDILFNPKVFRR